MKLPKLTVTAIYLFINTKGEFTVGTTDVHTDKVLFRLFYPCIPNGKPASWLPRNWLYTRGYLSFLRQSNFLTPFLSFFHSWIFTETFLNAPVVPDGDFPVLIFSHGTWVVALS